MNVYDIINEYTYNYTYSQYQQRIAVLGVEIHGM